MVEQWRTARRHALIVQRRLRCAAICECLPATTPLITARRYDWDGIGLGTPLPTSQFAQPKPEHIRKRLRLRLPQRSQKRVTSGNGYADAP